MRTNVYVDGFNLYYRCIKGTSFKWLDLDKMCSLLLPRHTIQRIRYFTAIVQARPGDPQQPQRQLTYIRALQTVPNLSVHYGSFLTNPVRLPVAHPRTGQPRTVEVLRTEEKGSDVNLATYLLVDGFKNDYDVAIVVSNDSDLKEPIEAVRRELRKQAGVLVPDRGQKNMKSALPADFYRRIRPGVLGASQFPAMLQDPVGTITKPATW
ncbi:MAG TPA: NYN domain-containing protein [Actinomycetota bacterium]